MGKSWASSSRKCRQHCIQVAHPDWPLARLAAKKPKLLTTFAVRGTRRTCGNNSGAADIQLQAWINASTTKSAKSRVKTLRQAVKRSRFPAPRRRTGHG